MPLTNAQPLAAWRSSQGGTAITSVSARAEFHNVELGVNECGPAAVLNRLLWLRTNFDLSMPDQFLAMDSMKTALNWGPTRVTPPYQGYLPGVLVGDKDQFMFDHDLPIQTIQTTNFNLVFDALAKGYDIEISMSGHVAVVVGLTALNNGKYVITLQDDSLQDFEGGLARYPVVYDPATDTLDGSPWGRSVGEFIIERPSP